MEICCDCMVVSVVELREKKSLCSFRIFTEGLINMDADATQTHGHVIS